MKIWCLNTMKNKIELLTFRDKKMKSRKKPIHPYLKEIGAHIKALRDKKQLSLETIGATIGIGGSNLQKIENGANITLSSLIKIFIVLEITPVQFFSGLSWEVTEDDIEELTTPRTVIKKKLKRKRKTNSSM